MKIIGFSQLHNEQEKGNLTNWFRCMNKICDHIYIYDQASDDGSDEIYKSEPKARVIFSETNDFKNEIKCKSMLLKTLLEEHPDVDWIFWMDGDTVIEKKGLSRRNVESMLKFYEDKNADGLRLGHYNLWRSKQFYRVDDSYHSIHDRGVLAFWKNNGKLKFPLKEGLHHQQFPDGIDNPLRANLSLIHMGFSTDFQIIKKYNVYKERGQSGWALERLLSEKTLVVEQLESRIIPKWISLENSPSPHQLKPLVEVYKNNE